MLTIDTLTDVWVSITMPWDRHRYLDESIFRENAAKLIEAGVHGIYTTGSTRECYALDFDEFERMVDIFAQTQEAVCAATQPGPSSFASVVNVSHSGLLAVSQQLC
jgi:dihydrodipicolinate synthase/N-acetylneuraminate lyase